MAKSSDVPGNGPLSGLKIYSTGQNLAQPFAAALAAAWGADVINSENTTIKCPSRLQKYWFEVTHRNMREIALNIPTPEGREIFTKLIKWCDIWMESSKIGTYEKWGLSDEYIWSINPKCVILHVSGFGQFGEPDYISRAANDATGQAFSGYLQFQGSPEMPILNKPATCDIITALYALNSCLAAYIKAQQTGKGESIDLAMFEAMFDVSAFRAPQAFNDGVVPVRDGSWSPRIAGWSMYQCKDGNWINFSPGGGVATVQRLLTEFGFQDDPDFDPKWIAVPRGGPAEVKIEGKIKELCETLTAEEFDALMGRIQVPCSMIMTYEQIMANKHYEARGDIVEWFDPGYGKNMKGFAFVPKFTNNPTQIWRGAPTFGMDNDDILEELGYSADEISALYEKKIVNKD